VFVPFQTFQPILIDLSKDGGLPIGLEHLSDVPTGFTLALLTKWFDGKGMRGTNTLAYLFDVSVMKNIL
jgi:hypothetical protein